MAIRSGRLRQRITLQSKTLVQDEFGHPVPTWSDTATVWALIKPSSAREVQVLDLQVQQVTHEIEMRYRQGVTPEMRVKHIDRHRATRYFDIEQVLEPMTAGERLVLMCKESV